jgi:UDP-galactopyranose mutase
MHKLRSYWVDVDVESVDKKEYAACPVGRPSALQTRQNDCRIVAHRGLAFRLRSNSGGRRMRKSVCVVGAGLSGAVIAHELACAGFECDVIEARGHVAGNCHTQRDPATGILVHAYGPHIFHTGNERVWSYIQRFDEFVPFVNRVRAVAGGQVYSLPINLSTINQFFGKMFSPEQAREFLNAAADRSIRNPRSFEEQALRFVGRELYEAFFKGYTIKQWGVDPAELPASILKRLPVRFNYDDSYYDSKYQGMPRHGYTHIVEKMLDHRNIHLALNTTFSRKDAAQACHTFYSGPLDAWFGFSEGRLGYRTLDFAAERHTGDFQGNPVINYCDAEVPWTRICEHKHFAPWDSHEGTVVFKEFSRSCGEGDDPCYPIRLVNDKRILGSYERMAAEESGVTFVGRLATYRYLDMDVTIEEALQASAQFIACASAAA